jgi:NIMA (never in mitosis gene a)-related kinase
MFIQMVRGLHALHRTNIFHRDMKSANIFLNKDGVTKLGDMNVSKVAKKGLLYTQTGTPYYASPEVWKDQPYNNKSDIWSMGCVLYESVCLKPPFRAENMEGLFKKILKGVYPRIPNQYSAELANVVKSLITVTPELRPSCDKILEMPIMVQKIRQLFPNDISSISIETSLLKTIRLPKNLMNLTDKLPKPNYGKPTSTLVTKREGIKTFEEARMKKVSSVI